MIFKRQTSHRTNSNRSNNDETVLLSIGAMLSQQQHLLNSKNINDYEFKIFSQFGDDGIIQFLIKNIDIKNQTFIEFGVEDYMESNTRFLLMNNNWSGFVMDGSQEAMDKLVKRKWYWRHDLNQRAVWIDKENINELLASSNFTDLGLLHIDIDGNDYFILKEIDFSKLNPSILILEYNSVFGKDRKISVPYNKTFSRTKSHYSNLFYGASLPALAELADQKGYSLIGCNLAGNNSYFVRKDLINDRVRELSVEEAFKESKFRESRNRDNKLTFKSGQDRLDVIKGLEVLNIETNQLEEL